MSQSPIIIQTTLPSEFNHEALRKDLILKQISACIHAYPSIQSTYMWDGNIETSSEQLLQIKTVVSLENQVINTIQEHHPYDVPEIITIPIQSMATDYSNWFYHQLKIQ